MARKADNKAAEASATKAAKTSGAPESFHVVGGSRRRGRVLVILGVALLCALGAKAAWRAAAPVVAGRTRYLLPAARITTTPTPEWLGADVRAQVIQNSHLDGRLSILDGDFVETLRQAFALHPWVQSVDRVEKSYPPAVHVAITYRRPVAVVETASGELLPVDASGSHLRSDDVPLIRRKYLPRITGIVGQPPVGQPWEDPRVRGAVSIAVRLTDVWEAMHLETIAPRARSQRREDQQFYVYDIVTKGGTQIIWGASPDAAPPGEADFLVKLERLRKCVEQYGPLDTPKAPGTVDVRGELHVEPRMVKNGEPRMANNTDETDSEAPLAK